MSRGMTFALQDLPVHLRVQAQRKLEGAGTVRKHECKDGPPAAGRVHTDEPTRIEYNGENLTVAEWSKKTGVSERTIRYRYGAGYPLKSVFRRTQKRKPTMTKLSIPEERLAFHLKAEGLAGFVREHRFSMKRKWRFDFAFLSAKLGIEIDGGAFSGGRHVRGNGFAADREKDRAAVMDGWRVLHYLPKDVRSGRAVREIKRALEEFRT